MNKLQKHYTGTTGSTLMTDRFKFLHASQNTNKTIKDWEVWICQAGSLCKYGEIADIMCHDKFFFGLCNNTIRTELLKTHLRPDNTPIKLWLTLLLNPWNLLKKLTNSFLIQPKELTKLSIGQGQGDQNHSGKSTMIWNWGGSQTHVIGVGIWEDRTSGQTAQLMDAPVWNVVGMIILHVYVWSSHLWIRNSTNLEITQSIATVKTKQSASTFNSSG